MATERIPVDIRHCAKTYADGTRALAPSNLHIEAGEVLALLGPSGCGKTTLLRLIAGLESADAGSVIRFGEQDVTVRPVEQRGVGMVFQSYALFPQMTVAANVGYGLRIRGTPRPEIERRVGELLELVRLNGLGHKRPAELSGGQRQRVALARAVAVRPRVLLLDEPLAALDAKLKESLRGELAELLRQLHITAVHVTHDQQEAMAIADRLAVMQAGHIVQVGTPEALYRHPGHPFVAEFLGRVNRVAVVDGALPFGAGVTLACPPALRAQRHVLLRPEDVQVTASQLGLATARVERRTFLGDRVQLHLALAGWPELLLADAPRDCAFAEGAQVGLHIDPARLMPGAGETAP